MKKGGSSYWFPLKPQKKETPMCAFLKQKSFCGLWFPSQESWKPYQVDDHPDGCEIHFTSPEKPNRMIRFPRYKQTLWFHTMGFFSAANWIASSIRSNPFSLTSDLSGLKTVAPQIARTFGGGAPHIFAVAHHRRAMGKAQV